MVRENRDTVDYVVQMKSDKYGWSDVVAVSTLDTARDSLSRWRLIHAGEEFQLVKRTFTQEVIPG